MSALDQERADILFKAAGGISDMASEEIRAIKNPVDEHVIGGDWDGSKHTERGGYNAAKAEARQSLWGNQEAGDAK